MSYSLPRSLSRLVSVVAATLLVSFAFVQSPNLVAAPADAAATNKAPLKHTFRKAKDSESGSYTLHLKNSAEQPLKVSGQVLLASDSFAPDKARPIAETMIAPGKSLKVPDLASTDKVTIKIEGYDTLQLVVPKKREKKADKTEKAEKAE